MSYGFFTIRPSDISWFSLPVPLWNGLQTGAENESLKTALENVGSLTFIANKCCQNMAGYLRDERIESREYFSYIRQASQLRLLASLLCQNCFGFAISATIWWHLCAGVNVELSDVPHTKDSEPFVRIWLSKHWQFDICHSFRRHLLSQKLPRLQQYLFGRVRSLHRRFSVYILLLRCSSTYTSLPCPKVKEVRHRTYLQSNRNNWNQYISVLFWLYEYLD